MDWSEGLNNNAGSLNDRQVNGFRSDYYEPYEKLEDMVKEACGIYGETGIELFNFSGVSSLGIESLVCSSVPINKSIAIINNSSRGTFIKRIAGISKVHYFEYLSLAQQLPDLEDIERFLLNHSSIAYVVLPLISIQGLEAQLLGFAQLLEKLEIGLLIDYYGKLEGFKLNVFKYHIDCISITPSDFRVGVLSSSVLVAQRRFLVKCEGNANSFSLDLYATWQKKIWNKSDLAV